MNDPHLPDELLFADVRRATDAFDPLPDGMVELWDPVGRRWGRSGTDSEGRFSFVVTKPEPLPGEAPRFDAVVFARGLLKQGFELSM